jgi:hypothetical protein
MSSREPSELITHHSRVQGNQGGSLAQEDMTTVYKVEKL